MKKIISFILILFVICILLCNCSCENRENIVNADTGSMFTVVEHSFGYNYMVIYHNNTKVMYSRSLDGHLTVLVDPDGSPMVYEGN
jgi:hypothetical protein